MNVPFVDLKAQHQALWDEINQAIQGVLERGDFILGKDVALFEEEFAAFCGTRSAVGVDSGLSALKLSLLAGGIGPGDEVILPANTFVATAAAVTFTGATPVLVDINPATFNIDTTQIEAAITPRTRAIIPVHLYGLPADMDEVRAIASKHSLLIVEDACQAHGAYYKGQRTGTLGHAAAFSFYPAKNLGACGDGGMMVTDDDQLAERVRTMRNCGQKVKYHHDMAPYNNRLDTMHAAVLRIKLRHLDTWSAARRSRAAQYSNLLADSTYMPPAEFPDREHVYHLYVIRTARREALQTHLKEHGVGTAIHYPVPIHMQGFYADSGYQHGQFPITEELADEIVSLPMFPEMTAEQVEYVVARLREF